MSVRWETITVDKSPMRVYMAVPDKPGPHPGIVIAQHAPGVDAAIQDVVNRLHRHGYAAAAPELYHRQPSDVKEHQARMALLRDDEVVADMDAAAELLKSQLNVGSLAVMGFCTGGRVAYLMACANREFQACAVFYGGNIMKSWGKGPTPLERSAEITCPIIGFFGAEDANPSPDDVRKVGAELTRLGKWHEFHVYNNAGHAFQNFLGERYRQRAARGSWGELLAFYDEFVR